MDIITYALLKRKMAMGGTTITGAKIEEGQLIFELSDGSTINAGTIEVPNFIDDAAASTTTTYSSSKIEELTHFDSICGGDANNDAAT